MKIVLSLLLLSLFSSCTKRTFVEDKVFAGNIKVSADTLNRGKEIYQLHCMACHGVNGDGLGVAHKGSKVPPRDLTMGMYKFGQVPAGELPHDEHFFRILREGLKGTSMLPWDLSEYQMFAVTQYIKTFAPDVWEGGEKRLGNEIRVTRDPYRRDRQGGIDRGREVYHGEANCQACHMGYVDLFEFNEINQEAFGTTVDRLPSDFYQVKPQFSVYGYQIIPPDFTWHEMRMSSTVEDLYIRLNAGIAGTTMPPWRGVLSDSDIWAIAHYVDYLAEYKDSPKRADFIDKLRAGLEQQAQ